MKNEPITVERVFNASLSSVWKAITDENDMRQWYFTLPGFKAEIGYEFRFTGGPDDRQYLHLCRITEVIPQRKLTYSWRYDGYEGSSLVTFELSEEGNKTRLKLTHSGLETFPANNPDFDKKNFAEGWKHIVTISLKDFLEKQTSG